LTSQKPPGDIQPEPPPKPHPGSRFTTILLRDRKTGVPSTEILEDYYEGEVPHKLLTADEKTTLMKELQAGSYEALDGTKQWTEPLTKKGWIATDRIKDPIGMKNKPQNWSELETALSEGKYASVHVTFTYSRMDEYLDRIKASDCELGEELPLLDAVAQHIQKGGLASIENPLTSKLWDQPMVRQLVTKYLMHNSRTDMCRWGSNVKGETRICSNIPKSYLREIEKARCNCYGRHGQEADQSHQKSNLINALANAHHQAWIAQQRPAPKAQLREINNRTLGALRTFSTVDSAADKNLLDTSEGGSYSITEEYGSINCSGFNNETTQLTLARAETVATTTTGKRVILVAQQAIVHQDDRMHSLIDPSAVAAAGGIVNINFTNSSGSISFGEHVIGLGIQGTGIGFHSQKPTPEERTTLFRITMSIAEYDKEQFLSKSNQFQSVEISDEESYLPYESLPLRTGTRMTKSK
jgi:hypothetical protein